MNQTIDNFKASFQEGFAKANFYKVYFTSTFADQLDLQCDAVTFPGKQILTQETYTDMRASKKVYAFTNDDVTITFNLSNNWFAWEYLKTWQSYGISNLDQLNNYYVNFKNEYTMDVDIHHLDSKGDVRKKVRLLNAYPTTLNSMELGNQNENTILRCTAVLSYDNWEII